MMKYKNYIAKVEFDDEANVFHGEIANIRDVVTFQGRSVKELHQAFEDSVDDYLAFCKKRGEDPEKPFSGRLMIRLTPQQHRNIFISAKQTGKSLNAWIAEQLSHVTAV